MLVYANVNNKSAISADIAVSYILLQFYVYICTFYITIL